MCEIMEGTLARSPARHQSKRVAEAAVAAGSRWIIPPLHPGDFPVQRFVAGDEFGN